MSEAEVALSREHSKTRLLETKINEIESLKALLEQDCRSFSERIEQLQQEKDQSKVMLERIQEELSDNREKTIEVNRLTVVPPIHPPGAMTR